MKQIINHFENEYAFLSNFYDSPIPFWDGEKWIFVPTVEHAFQASKSVKLKERLYVARAPSPGAAKKRGRKVALRDDWEDKKISIMRDYLTCKFAIPELREKLLATKDEELIEGNWWHDNFWGDCYCEKCKNIKGKNILGKLLMKERKSIKESTIRVI